MAENQKMEIDLGEDVAQGNYINLAIIAHSVSEFIIDFATVLPGVPKAKVNQLMDQLYEVGARGIIVTALQASRM